MKYLVYYSRRFIKSLKKFKKNKNFDNTELRKVISYIAKGAKLPPKYKDHKLKGKLKDFRECHIKPDILLLYKKDEKEKVIILLDIGSHSEFF